MCVRVPVLLPCGNTVWCFPRTRGQPGKRGRTGAPHRGSSNCGGFPRQSTGWWSAGQGGITAARKLGSHKERGTLSRVGRGQSLGAARVARVARGRGLRNFPSCTDPPGSPAPARAAPLPRQASRPAHRAPALDHPRQRLVRGLPAPPRPAPRAASTSGRARSAPARHEGGRSGARGWGRGRGATVGAERRSRARRGARGAARARSAAAPRARGARRGAAAVPCARGGGGLRGLGSGRGRGWRGAAGSGGGGGCTGA
jgi:hypothetical protein